MQVPLFPNKEPTPNTALDPNISIKQLQDIIAKTKKTSIQDQYMMSNFFEKQVEQFKKIKKQKYESSRCRDYANMLKIYYLFGIIFVYFIIIVRILSWLFLIVAGHRIFTNTNKKTIEIDTDPIPEKICVKHNYDAGKYNNPCSEWLYRWHSSIDIDGTPEKFIINTNNSKKPTHVCKSGSKYNHPCTSYQEIITKFFILFLIVVIIEVIYSGYLYDNNCSLKFKTYKSIPSYIFFIVFIVSYLSILKHFGTIARVGSSIKEDMMFFFDFLYL